MSAWPKRSCSAVVLFACALALFGCTAIQRPVATSPALVTPSAEQVVRSYYTAMAAGDTATVDALTTESWRRQLAESDYKELPQISVANLKMGAFKTLTTDRLASQLSYAAVQETYVQYDLLKDTPFEDAGRTGRFVMVAQETTGAPWLIDGEGTGP